MNTPCCCILINPSIGWHWSCGWARIFPVVPCDCGCGRRQDSACFINGPTNVTNGWKPIDKTHYAVLTHLSLSSTHCSVNALPSPIVRHCALSYLIEKWSRGWVGFRLPLCEHKQVKILPLTYSAIWHTFSPLLLILLQPTILPSIQSADSKNGNHFDWLERVGVRLARSGRGQCTRIVLRTTLRIPRADYQGSSEYLGL